MRTLSPTAMLVRAGHMHDDGDVKMSETAMRDLWRIMDIIPGDEAALDAAWDELVEQCLAVVPA
jgi:hypothetical protein